MTTTQPQPVETSRPATPTDPPCSCGRAARVIYLTEKFGEVPSCR